MKTFSLSTTLVILLSLAFGAGDGTILHWSMDEGSGTETTDRTGNGFAAAHAAEWIRTPGGGALFIDGKGGYLKTRIKDRLLLGKNAFTLSLWVKPFQFQYDDRQNQRRLVSYGPYPDGFLVMDITGKGALGFYCGYKDGAGKVVSMGGGSAQLSTNVWSHVVFVFDPAARRVSGYRNGAVEFEQDMPAGFQPDFSREGDFTIGSGWHNYWGAVDEVRLEARPLSAAEVRGLFEKEAAGYGISALADIRLARQDAMETLGRIGDAYVAADFSAGRRLANELLAKKGLEPQVYSLARLRLAQGFEAAGDFKNASAVYQAMVQDPSVPGVHAAEAREAVAELKRAMEGKNPRDPMASRTAVPPLPNPGLELFVAPAGNDGNPGTADKPVATLERARDLVRERLRTGLPAGGIRVTLKAGVHVRTASFSLGLQDSGTAASPIVWRSETPGAAVLYGGKTIEGFTPVTDPTLLSRLPAESRGKVLASDLKRQGITDYGRFVPRGMSAGGAGGAVMELFWNELPQTVARWPNEGFAHIADVVVKDGNNINGFSGSKTPKFLYEGDRPSRWAEEKDIWMLGYWFWDWAESQLRVESIDPQTRTVTLDKAKESYGWRKGQRYYAYNLFSEIDRPGEWVVDRDTGMLYVWPPSDPGKSKVELGLLSPAMVVLSNVSHVRFEGLTLDLARHNGIEVEGSTNVLFVGCLLTRLGGGGMKVTGGKGVGVHSCDIGMLGRYGVHLEGGNRATLTPADHFIENTQVYSNSRIDPTYTPSALARGVGIRVSHNLFHHNPSSALRFEGNEILIEYNETHSVVLESDDQGAMESFGNPTFRGIVLRHNLFHHIGGTATLAGQAAIRFDDAISGMVVYGNIMERAASGHFGGVQINSGRDNVMDNNLFIDCQFGITGGWNPGNKHWGRFREGGKLNAGDITNELLLSKYPAMKTMLDDQGRNFSWRNLFIETGKPIGGNRVLMDQWLAGVYTNRDPGFVPGAPYRLTLASEGILRHGLRPIPVEEMGLYGSPWRKTFPLRPPVAPIPSWKELKKTGAASQAHPMAPIALRNQGVAPTSADLVVQKGVALTLKETPSRGDISGAAAKAWLYRNGETLHLTVKIPSGKRVTGKGWGRSDGMEICFREARDIADGVRSPTLILQGFPDGARQVAPHPDEDGFDREMAKVESGTTFRATAVEGEWRGDWTIPLSALGITATQGKRIQFNIGVHRTDPEDWIALAGCLGANYKVENGAVLVLE